MNIKELGTMITDKAFGQRINGTVAAVMPDEISSEEIIFTRYIVKTGNEYFDVRLLRNHGINLGLTPASLVETPQLSVGDNISVRSSNIKPWLDGSR